MLFGFAVLPGVVGLALGGPVGAPALVVGVLVGLLGSISSGSVIAVRVVPFAAAAFALGGLAVGTGWWIVVSFAFAVLAGYSVRWGTMPPFALAAIVAVTTKSIDGVGAAAVGVAFVIVGGMLGIQLTRRLGVPVEQRMTGESRAGALLSASVLSVAVAIGCTIAHFSDWPLGYWIPMTTLVVAQPTVEGRRQHTRDRLKGTLLGFVVLIPLALFDVPRPAVQVAAALAVLLILAVPTPYWLRSLFTTVAVILVMAPREAVFEVAERRVLATLLGVAILAAVGVVAQQSLQRDPLQ